MASTEQKVRFHISAKGNPEECHATIRDCPLGGAHFDTEAEAYASLRTENGGTFGNATLTKHRVRQSELTPEQQLHKKSSGYLANGDITPAVKDGAGNIIRPALTYEDYYKGINKRAFRQYEESDEEFAKKRGSQFDSDVRDLDDLLYRTLLRRNNTLGGDDKEQMVKMGADPQSFKKGYRYVLSPVGGNLGIINSNRLPDDTPVEYYESPPNSNRTEFVVKAPRKPKVKYSTLVFKKDDTGKDVLVDAYPGFNKKEDAFRKSLNVEQQKALDAKEKSLIAEMSQRGILTIGNIKKVKSNLRKQPPQDFNIDVIV